MPEVLVMAGVCVIGLLCAVLLGITMQDVPQVLIPSGLALLAGALLLVRRTASSRIGTTKTLCVLFFSLATAHIFIGFLAAGLTTTHTSIRSNEDVYYANALLINGAGLMATALGFAWKLSPQLGTGGAAFRDPVDARVFERLLSVFLITGSLIMFGVYWRLGFMEYLAVPAKWPFLRYITSDLAGGSATDEWLANRAMDLLTVALPFLVYRAAKRPRILAVALIAVGFSALLLPLRRANILGVIFASLILIGIGRHDVYRLTRRWILTGISLYVLSQCLFLGEVLAHDFTPHTVLAVSSTALPEVRDLAWTLNRLGGEKLDGTTFIQALLPLPSIASDWSAKHSLRAISTKLIGVDQTGQSGGLRLTLMGEGYINFGYLGTILASFVWGCGVAWCEERLRVVEGTQSEFANYLSVMCFVWLCFLIYLAGTQAAAFVKMGTLLILGAAVLCRHRPGVVDRSESNGRLFGILNVGVERAPGFSD
jgi:hypothetical protein